jgi:molybdate transport system regulatory protein
MPSTACSTDGFVMLSPGAAIDCGATMASVTIRIDLPGAGAVGPGKIRLLELIGETGSIAAAGRAMKMSYRRAWLLVDELNALFREPLTVAKLGGRLGGGATLTPLGQALVKSYRAVETAAHAAAARSLLDFDAAVKRGAPRSRARAGSRAGSTLPKRRAPRATAPPR